MKEAEKVRRWEGEIKPGQISKREGKRAIIIGWNW
jgi:hypothetical protein